MSGSSSTSDQHASLFQIDFSPHEFSDRRAEVFLDTSSQPSVGGAAADRGRPHGHSNSSGVSSAPGAEGT